MLEQKADFLTRRLADAHTTCNYDHCNGSQDLLKELRGKYDKLAKASYFTSALQQQWEVRIMDFTDQLDCQSRTQKLVEEDQKSKVGMRRKRLSNLDGKISDLTDSLNFPCW